MFLHGVKFKVITDHQPLVVLYNNPGNREADYNSRHALKHKIPEIEDEDDDEEFYVNAIIDAQFPHAIRLEMIGNATNESETMAQLKYWFLNKYIPDTPNLRPYKDIFSTRIFAAKHCITVSYWSSGSHKN